MKLGKKYLGCFLFSLNIFFGRKEELGQRANVKARAVCTAWKISKDGDSTVSLGGSTSIPMYKTNLRRPKDGNRADPWLPKCFLDVLHPASLGGEIPHESLC